MQAASHQRQLSLKYSEIQQRLIDNQSLLNSLEKAGGPCTLENLLAELKRRVEQDKEALRQWTALRKSTSGANTKNPALAARLLQFARGCALALQFMSEDNPQVRLNGGKTVISQLRTETRLSKTLFFLFSSSFGLFPPFLSLPFLLWRKETELPAKREHS